MKKELILNLLPQPQAVTPNEKDASIFTLAPHPLYFTVDGKPTKTSVKIKDKEYEVEWDGEKLDIEEKPSYPWAKFDLSKYDNPLDYYSAVIFKFLFLAFPMILGIWLWSLIILLILTNWKWLLISLIGGAIFLPFLTKVLIQFKKDSGIDEDK